MSFERRAAGADASPRAEAARRSPERKKEESMEELQERGKKALGKASAVLDDLERGRTSPDHVAQIAKKVGRASLSFAKGVSRLSILIAMGMAGNYARTYESVTEKTGGDTVEGEIEFEHSDPETTHILNYLAGKEKLSIAERTAMVRRIVKDEWIPELKFKVPDDWPSNFEDASEEEFLDYATEIYYTDMGNLLEHWIEKKESTRKYLEKMRDEGIPEAYDFNPKVYRALWQMEESVGSPKIRWAYRYGDTSEIGSFEGRGRAHYDGINNSMYIHPSINSSLDEASLSYEDLFAESAHALQFRKKPITSVFKIAENGIRIAMTALDENVSMYDAQLKEYSIPGSIEEEAHERIEPTLKEKYGPVRAGRKLALKNKLQ